ncbi:copper amine oxidase N-terminal domain-containing protein, partial [Alkalithermobacter paradoxus]|uniref:copper amine oxidase N-terminal domain-containing protein n=1 Tax=Alkalithermobacter paradoxus TaxID=29349 RepID=UPI002F918017
MKKILLSVLIMLTLTSVSSAQVRPNVVLNNTSVSFPDARPFIDSANRTLIPVRFISEQMGSNVHWDSNRQEVTIEGNGKIIKLKINETKALVNGKTITFDTKAIISQSRTFVPLRFVSEALGATVHWDSKTRTVNITAQTPAPAPSTGNTTYATGDRERDIKSLAALIGSNSYDSRDVSYLYHSRIAFFVNFSSTNYEAIID